jgi:dihydrolipoyl dehydrogenase
MAAESKENQFDVAVLGAGPGGYAGAFRAADLGLSVALVGEEARPGGVCLFRGCIPSKALLHVAKQVLDARDAPKWGVDFGKPGIDVDKVRDFKNGVVDRLTGGLSQLAGRRNVRYVRGRAGLADPHTLEIETGDAAGERIRADSVILATGSAPARPSALFIDSPLVLDSRAALAIETVPETLLVIGGGYIGLELGTVYAALGSRVTVVEMTEGLLPRVDRDLVRILEKRLGDVFESFHLSTRVGSMKETSDGAGIQVAFDGEGKGVNERVFDEVLVAVGRRPRSDVPGLARTRAQIDERGFVAVDSQRRTAEPSLFAIGDVAGEPMLAHKAFREGKVAAEAIAGESSAFDVRAIPAVVFTDPEIAWCGLTETAARAEGRKVAVARFPWEASGRALTLGRPGGVTKLVVDPEDGTLLGAGFAGTGAGELVAEAVLAVEMGANATDAALSIHPHPTLSETVMEAAEVFLGQSTHLYRKKKDG